MCHGFDNGPGTGDHVSSSKDSLEICFDGDGTSLYRSPSGFPQSFKGLCDRSCPRSTDGDKDRIIRFVKIFEGDVPSHFSIETDLYSHLVNYREVSLYDLSWQTIGRETMGEKTSQFILSFEKSGANKHRRGYREKEVFLL